MKAVGYLTEGAITVAEGQMLDMVLPKMESVGIDMYINMVEKKTAALFMASVAMGATLAGANQELVFKLREAMRLAGIAFQIRDDILGLVGDEKVLGKPILSDLREGKRTILVIYALQRLNEEDRRKLLTVLGNREASVEELKEAAEMIKRVGAVEYADMLAEDYAEKARRVVASIESRDVEAKSLLADLVEYLVKRRY